MAEMLRAEEAAKDERHVRFVSDADMPVATTSLANGADGTAAGKGKLGAGKARRKSKRTRRTSKGGRSKGKGKGKGKRGRRKSASPTGRSRRKRGSSKAPKGEGIAAAGARPVTQPIFAGSRSKAAGDTVDEAAKARAARQKEEDEDKHLTKEQKAKKLEDAANKAQEIAYRELEAKQALEYAKVTVEASTNAWLGVVDKEALARRRAIRVERKRERLERRRLRAEFAAKRKALAEARAAEKQRLHDAAVAKALAQLTEEEAADEEARAKALANIEEQIAEIKAAEEQAKKETEERRARGEPTPEPSDEDGTDGSKKQGRRQRSQGGAEDAVESSFSSGTTDSDEWSYDPDGIGDDRVLFYDDDDELERARLRYLGVTQDSGIGDGDGGDGVVVSEDEGLDGSRSGGSPRALVPASGLHTSPVPIARVADHSRAPSATAAASGGTSSATITAHGVVSGEAAEVDYDEVGFTPTLRAAITIKSQVPEDFVPLVRIDARLAEVEPRAGIPLDVSLTGEHYSVYYGDAAADDKAQTPPELKRRMLFAATERFGDPDPLTQPAKGDGEVRDPTYTDGRPATPPFVPPPPAPSASWPADVALGIDVDAMLRDRPLASPASIAAAAAGSVGVKSQAASAPMPPSVAKALAATSTGSHGRANLKGDTNATVTASAGAWKAPADVVAAAEQAHGPNALILASDTPAMGTQPRNPTKPVRPAPPEGLAADVAIMAVGVAGARQGATLHAVARGGDASGFVVEEVAHVGGSAPGAGGFGGGAMNGGGSEKLNWQTRAGGHDNLHLKAPRPPHGAGKTGSQAVVTGPGPVPRYMRATSRTKATVSNFDGDHVDVSRRLGDLPDHATADTVAARAARYEDRQRRRRERDAAGGGGVGGGHGGGGGVGGGGGFRPSPLTMVPESEGGATGAGHAPRSDTEASGGGPGVGGGAAVPPLLARIKNAAAAKAEASAGDGPSISATGQIVEERSDGPDPSVVQALLGGDPGLTPRQGKGGKFFKGADDSGSATGTSRRGGGKKQLKRQGSSVKMIGWNVDDHTGVADNDDDNASVASGASKTSRASRRSHSSRASLQSHNKTMTAAQRRNALKKAPIEPDDAAFNSAMTFTLRAPIGPRNPEVYHWYLLSAAMIPSLDPGTLDESTQRPDIVDAFKQFKRRQLMVRQNLIENGQIGLVVAMGKGQAGGVKNTEGDPKALALMSDIKAQCAKVYRCREGVFVRLALNAVALRRSVPLFMSCMKGWQLLNSVVEVNLTGVNFEGVLNAVPLMPALRILRLIGSPEDLERAAREKQRAFAEQLASNKAGRRQRDADAGSGDDGSATEGEGGSGTDGEAAASAASAAGTAAGGAAKARATRKSKTKAKAKGRGKAKGSGAVNHYLSACFHECARKFGNQLQEITVHSQWPQAKQLDHASTTLSLLAARNAETLVTLDFTDNGASRNTLRVLASFLDKLPPGAPLKNFRLDDNLDRETRGECYSHWFRRNIDEAANTLVVDNEPTLRDPEYALGLALAAKSLVAMEVRNCDMGALQIELAGALPHNTCLKKLTIYACNLADEGLAGLARSLEHNRTLQEVDVRGNPSVTQAGVDTLRQCILAYPECGLQSVQVDEHINTRRLVVALHVRSEFFRDHATLFETDLQPEVAEIVAEMVLRATHLKSLDISGNPLGDGIVHIVEALKTNAVYSKLVDLDLADCCMTDVGAKSVASLLVMHPSLRGLNVQDNWVTSEGAGYLAKAAQEKAERQAKAELEVLQKAQEAAAAAAAAKVVEYDLFGNVVETKLTEDEKRMRALLLTKTDAGIDFGDDGGQGKTEEETKKDDDERKEKERADAEAADRDSTDERRVRDMRKLRAAAAAVRASASASRAIVVEVEGNEEMDAELGSGTFEGSTSLERPKPPPSVPKTGAEIGVLEHEIGGIVRGRQFPAALLMPPGVKSDTQAKGEDGKTQTVSQTRVQQLRASIRRQKGRGGGFGAVAAGAGRGGRGRASAAASSASGEAAKALASGNGVQVSIGRIPDDAVADILPAIPAGYAPIGITLHANTSNHPKLLSLDAMRRPARDGILEMYHGLSIPEHAGAYETHGLRVAFFEGYLKPVWKSDVFDWRIIDKRTYKIRGRKIHVRAHRNGYYRLLWDLSKGMPWMQVHLLIFSPAFGWGVDEGRIPLYVLVLPLQSNPAVFAKQVRSVEAKLRASSWRPMRFAGSAVVNVRLGRAFRVVIGDRARVIRVFDGKPQFMKPLKVAVDGNAGDLQNIPVKVFVYDVAKPTEESEGRESFRRRRQATLKVVVPIVNRQPDAPTGFMVKERNSDRTVFRVDALSKFNAWNGEESFQVYIQRKTLGEYTRSNAQTRDLPFVTIDSELEGGIISVRNSFYSGLFRISCVNAFGESPYSRSVQVHPANRVHQKRTESSSEESDSSGDSDENEENEKARKKRLAIEKQLREERRRGNNLTRTSSDEDDPIKDVMLVGSRAVPDPALLDKAKMPQPAWEGELSFKRGETEFSLPIKHQGMVLAMDSKKNRDAVNEVLRVVPWDKCVAAVHEDPAMLLEQKRAKAIADAEIVQAAAAARAKAAEEASEGGGADGSGQDANSKAAKRLTAAERRAKNAAAFAAKAKAKSDKLEEKKKKKQKKAEKKSKKDNVDWKSRLVAKHAAAEAGDTVGSSASSSSSSDEEDERAYNDPVADFYEKPIPPTYCSGTVAREFFWLYLSRPREDGGAGAVEALAASRRRAHGPSKLTESGAAVAAKRREREAREIAKAAAAGAAASAHAGAGASAGAGSAGADGAIVPHPPVGSPSGKALTSVRSAAMVATAVGLPGGGGATSAAAADQTTNKSLEFEKTPGRLHLSPATFSGRHINMVNSENERLLRKGLETLLDPDAFAMVMGFQIASCSRVLADRFPHSTAVRPFAPLLAIASRALVIIAGRAETHRRNCTALAALYSDAVKTCYPAFLEHYVETLNVQGELLKIVVELYAFVAGFSGADWMRRLIDTPDECIGRFVELDDKVVATFASTPSPALLPYLASMCLPREYVDERVKNDLAMVHMRFALDVVRPNVGKKFRPKQKTVDTILRNINVAAEPPSRLHATEVLEGVAAERYRDRMRRGLAGEELDGVPGVPQPGGELAGAAAVVT